MFTAIFDYLTIDHAGAAVAGGVATLGSKYLWKGVAYVTGRVSTAFKAIDAFNKAAEAALANAQASAVAKATAPAPASAMPAPIPAPATLAVPK